MAAPACLPVRRAMTTYDFHSPPYVGSLTRQSNPNLPREITMRDLAALTVTHQVGTREFSAAVWYALRSAYSGRHRQTSPSLKTKTPRSGSRIPVKSKKQASPQAHSWSTSSSTSPSSTSTIRPGRNSVMSGPRTRVVSRSPSPFSLCGPLDTETTSYDDESRSSNLSSPVIPLSISLENSHIDHEPALFSHTNRSDTARIGQETLITRENMEAALSKLRQEAEEHQLGTEVSEMSLVDGNIYRPSRHKQKIPLRSRRSSSVEKGK